MFISLVVISWLGLLAGGRAEEVAKSTFSFDFSRVAGVDLQPLSIATLAYSGFLEENKNFAVSGSYNSIQLSLPEVAGPIKVTVGDNCVGPIASISDTGSSSGKIAQNAYSVTAADVVNYLPYMDSQNIKISSFPGAFDKTFAFDKSQYVSINKQAFLTVFCPKVADRTQMLTLTVTASSYTYSKSFTYWNQFGAENRKVTFTIEPNTIFVISAPNPIDTLYFQLSYTGTSGLKYFDTNNAPQDFPPDYNLVFKVNPDSNRDLRLVSLVLSNPNSIAATLNLSISKYYSLPGWKIAIIVVFSVLGGLALIVGLIFVTIAIIRSKPAVEYPKEPKGVFGVKTEENVLKSSQNYEMLQKTPIPDTSEGKTPVVVIGQGQYPDLEGDQPAINQDHAIPVQSENFTDMR